MDPIRAYIIDGTLPMDPKEADKVKKRSNWFILYEGILHKRSFARPLLCCVTPEEGRKILEDAMTLVRTCDKSQKFAPIERAPPPQ